MTTKTIQHAAELRPGPHSRSLVAACSCGWRTEAPDILSRAREVMAHLKAVKADPRTWVARS